MKICLYLEFYHAFGGKLYKNIGTGLLSSYRNQKEVLSRSGIEFVETWDDSCDILQINTPWLNSLRLIKKAKRRGMPVAIWSHVTAEDAREVFWFNKFLYPLIRLYLKYAYGQADIVFCPSEYTKSLLINYGLPAEKLVAVSNGVDVHIFKKDEAKRTAAREEYNLDGIVIGTVGLAIPRKGIETFLALARAFPKNKFVWFGKIYSSLMAKPLPKNIPPNVIFTGYVHDIVAAFNALDIYIFPSYEENQGMTNVESAAVGVPMLLRNLPAYKGYFTDESDCLMAHNENEFVPKLTRLLENKQERDLLAARAKERVVKEQSLEACGQKMRALYERLLEKAPPLTNRN
jgi:1,2-diacylglycerol-3-alpha-glucose alpha-1,2-glucosyltransferase